MKQTKLIEFKNKSNEILRGILTFDKVDVKAVLIAGGFERSATTEKKFKVLADRLVEKGIPSLRFDYTGIGLSDGDFFQTTIKRMSKDFMQAFEVLKEETGCEHISVIAHSLSACAVAIVIKKLSFKEVVLIAPGLNQKDLFRYWFVISTIKEENPDIEISWHNFKKYLNEEIFIKDCKRTDKMTKTNYINAGYFLENKEKDYSRLLTNKQNILYIYGDNDDKVPAESLNVKFANKVIVKGGDHDLERPDMIKQWLNKAIDFIKS